VVEELADNVDSVVAAEDMHNVDNSVNNMAVTAGSSQPA
jgi:hypothetical protein